MRKLLFLALMCLVVAGLFAETITIGTGTSGVSTAPIYNLYETSVSQMLYTSSELATLGLTRGTISHIMFQAGSSTVNLRYAKNWDIRMMETDANNLNAWLPAATTVVFSGLHGVATIPANGWIDFTLTTQFEYSGEHNLLIQVVDRDRVASEYETATFAHTSTGSVNMTRYARKDAAAYDPTNNSSWTDSATSITTRPNTRITYTPLTPTDGLDLAIRMFTAPANLQTGTSDIVVNVMNMGTTSVTSYAVDFFDSNLTTRLNAYDIVGTTALTTSFSQANVSVEPTEYNTWVPTNAGNIQLRAVVRTAQGTDLVPSNNTSYAPTYYGGNDNLAITAFTGPAILPTTLGFTINVKNVGLQAKAASAYNVGVYIGATEVFELNEVSLAPGADQDFTVAYTDINAIAQQSGSVVFTAKITNVGDQDLSDNERPLTASWYSTPFDTDGLVEIGIQGTTFHPACPITFYWEDSISQSVYLASELGGQPGHITHINLSLYITNAMTQSYNPVQFFMKNDSITSFDAPQSWITSGFTRVVASFAQPVTTTGLKNFWIPLDEPFLYTGGSLVIMAFSDQSRYLASQTNGYLVGPDSPSYMSIFRYGDGQSFSTSSIPGTSGTDNFAYSRPEIRFAFNLPVQGTELVFTSISGPANSTQGTSFTFNLQNIGSQQITGSSYTIKLYDTANPVVTDTPFKVINGVTIDGNAFANQPITIAKTDGSDGWDSWAFTKWGDLTITAIIDIADIDNTNNTKTHAFYRTPQKDLEVLPFTASAPTILPTATPINFTIRNNGTEVITTPTYTIRVYDGSNITNIVVPPKPMAANADSVFTITRAQLQNADFNTLTGTLTLKVEIVYSPDDQVPSNNMQTHDMTWTDMDEDIFAEVGQGGQFVASTQNNGPGVPISLYLNDSVSQSLYRASELLGADTVGEITKIHYTARMATATTVAQPVTIYMANAEIGATGFTNTGTTWVPFDRFTKVAECEFPITGQTGDIPFWIDLDTTFPYTGKDLVIMVHKETTAGGLGANTGQSGFLYSPTVANTFASLWATNNTGNYNIANIASQGVGGRPSYKPQMKFAFNYPAGTDLAIASVTGPATWAAGIAGDDGIPIKILVRNMGANPTAAAAYSIKIYEGANPDPVNDDELYEIVASEALALDGAVYDEQEHEIPSSVWSAWASDIDGVGNVVFTAVLDNWATDANPDNDAFNAYTMYIRPDRDLEMATFTGPTTLPTAHNLSYTIRNIGQTVAAGAYSVKIYGKTDNGTETEIHEITGTTDNPEIAGGTTSSALTITAATINEKTAGLPVGLVTLRLEIVWSTEQIIDDKNTMTFTIQKPYMGIDSIQEIGVSSTTPNRYVPIDMGSQDSVAQTIYTAADLGSVSEGIITHLGYRVRKANATAAVSPYPVTIWLANSTLTEYPGNANNNQNWVAIGQFIQVATNYNLPIPLTGDADIWITLDTPFRYTGGSLVVMTLKDHAVATGTTDLFFTTTGTNCSLYRTSNTAGSTFTATNPGAGNGTRVGNKPVMRVGFSSSGFGILTGVAKHQPTGEGGLQNLEGVRVSQGQTFTETIADGTYSILVKIDASAADIAFSKLGYATQYWPATSSQFNWSAGPGIKDGTYEAFMLPAQQYTVSGTIIRGDNGQPVTQEVTVNIGDTFHATTSTGTFSIANVWGDSFYDISVVGSVPGFHNIAMDHVFISHPASGNEIVLDPIVLPEIMNIPAMVNATLAANDDRIITWQAPGTTEQRITWDLNGTADQSYYWNVSGYQSIQAHHFTAAHLTSFGVTGGSVSAVQFVPHSSRLSEYTIKIWVGSNLANPNMASPNHTQVVTQNITLGAWNTVNLTTPVQVPAGNELLIGIETPDIDLMTCDLGNGTNAAYVAARNYGDRWYITAFDEWTTLYTENGSSGYYDIWRIGAYLLVPPASGVAQAPMLLSIGASPEVSEHSISRSFDRPFTATRTLATIAPEPNMFASSNVRILGSGSDTRAFTNKYHVIRQILTGGVWITDQALTTGPEFITGTSYTDNSTHGVAEYRYSVQTVYEGSTYEDPNDANSRPWTFSDAAYSNIINFAASIDVTVNVTALDNGNVEGAFVGATPGTVSATIASGETSVVLALVPNRNYTLTISLAGYALRQVTINYAEDASLNVVIAPALQAFAENFADEELPTDWVNDDSNADDYLWRFGVDNQGRPAAFSESLCWDTGQCVYPDNWLITPAIELPYHVASLDLSYWAAPNSSVKVNERLFVYITENIAETTPSWEDFLVNRVYTNPTDGWTGESLVDDVELLNNTNFETGAWVPFVDDLSLYAGKTVYIAFRHAHSKDQDALKLADIQITYTNLPEYFVAGVTYAGATTSPVLSEITLTHTGDEDKTYTETTDTDGAFEFAGVTQGTYHVTATGTFAGNTYTYTSPVDEPLEVISHMDDYVINMVKITFNVGGTIKMFNASDPLPINNAELVLTSTAGGDTPQTYTTTSNPSGQFTFTGVIPDTYTISATGTHAGADFDWDQPGEITVEDTDISTVTVMVNGLVYTISGHIYTSDNPAVGIVGADMALMNPGTPPTATTYIATSTTGGVFEFTNVLPGNYVIRAAGTHSGDSYYQVTTTPIQLTNQNITNVVVTITGLDDIDVVAPPAVTVLKSNYPNPFNPSTTIAFDVANAGYVSIEVYNIKGQRVRTLVNDNYVAGRHTVVWNGDDTAGRQVGSGVYFYRMTTPEYSSVKKMLLMK